MILDIYTGNENDDKLMLSLVRRFSIFLPPSVAVRSEKTTDSPSADLVIVLSNDPTDCMFSGKENVIVISDPVSLHEFEEKIRGYISSFPSSEGRSEKISLDKRSRSAGSYLGSVILSEKEYMLLSYLMSRRSSVCDISSIYDKIWNTPDVSLRIKTDNVRVYINKLKKKLKKIGAADAVKNIANQGYIYD